MSTKRWYDYSVKANTSSVQTVQKVQNTVVLKFTTLTKTKT